MVTEATVTSKSVAEKQLLHRVDADCNGFSSMGTMDMKIEVAV